MGPRCSTRRCPPVHDAGEIQHVDFGCLFDKGLTLEVPELVPFRSCSHQA